MSKRSRTEGKTEKQDSSPETDVHQSLFGRSTKTMRRMYEPDLLLSPWHRTMRALSHPTSLPPGMTGVLPDLSMDFHYQIPVDQCTECRPTSGLAPLPPMPYNLWIVAAPSIKVAHDCAQRAMEKTPLSMIVVWIQDTDHPSGHTRTFVPNPEEKLSNFDENVSSFREFGHLLDHCGTFFVYDPDVTVGLLRFKPFLLTDLRHIDVVHDFRQFWPAMHDTVVPKKLRPFWYQYLAQGPFPFETPAESTESRLSLTVPMDIVEDLPPTRPQSKSPLFDTQNARTTKSPLTDKENAKPPKSPLMNKKSMQSPLTDKENTNPTKSVSSSSGVEEDESLMVALSFERYEAGGRWHLVDPPKFDDKDWEDVLDTPSEMWNWTYDPKQHAAMFDQVEVPMNKEKTNPLQQAQTAPKGLKGQNLLVWEEQRRKERLQQKAVERSVESKNVFPKSFGPDAKKPPGTYFSADRMRSWLAKVQSVADLFADECYRRFNFLLILRMNCKDPLWTGKSLRFARLETDDDSGSGLWTLDQYVNAAKSGRYADIHQSLLRELRYWVDFSRCVYVADMHLKYPKPNPSGCDGSSIAVMAGRALHKRYGLEYASKQAFLPSR